MSTEGSGTAAIRTAEEGTAGPGRRGRAPSRAAVAARWSARLAGAAMLAAMAGIHLKLYRAGYSALPVIGPLFLANAISGCLAGLAVLLAPRRWLPPVAAGGALLLAGTLAGLLISLTHGLFGFVESARSPYVGMTIAVEVVGVVILAGLAATSGSSIAARRDRPAGHG
jgi:hypothetical protein